MCTAKVDMAIVIDNSGSIEARDRDGYFEKIKMFVKNVVKTFEIGTKANIAVVEAAQDATVIAKFGDIKTRADFETTINNIQYKKQRSFVGEECSSK